MNDMDIIDSFEMSWIDKKQVVKLEEKQKIYCKCGCKKLIIITEKHRYVGIPKYIRGHNRKGIKHLDETKKKMSESHKGHISWNKGNRGLYKHSEKTKRKISIANTGKHYTPETCKKMSDLKKEYYKTHDSWNNGKTGVYSEDTLKKMSIVKIGKIQTEEHKKKNSMGLKRHYEEHTVWNKGILASEEHKRKNSEGLKEYYRYNSVWNKGKTLEEQHGIKKANDIKVKVSGENNSQWKGGISKEPYPFEFDEKLKEFIRQRDNFSCQECCYTEEELDYTLHVHHIDYDKLNINLWNLISLCKSCHSKTNINREYWKNHFRRRVICI